MFDEQHHSSSDPKHAWANTLAVPYDRLQTEAPNALFADDQLEPYLKEMCTDSRLNSFRDYIGLSTARKASCSCSSHSKPCIPWCTMDGPVPGPMLNVDILNDYAQELASAMKRSNSNHMQRAHFSEQQSRLLFCQGCCCTLLKFDMRLIKARQPLQCFSLVWRDQDENCHVPNNLIKILCRACHVLWDLCDRHAVKFNAACDVYFRGYGRSIHHPQTTYYAHIMDVPSVRCVNSNELKERLPLGAIKAAWLMQVGLVCYPLHPQAREQQTQNLVDAYQWTQARPLNLTTRSSRSNTQSEEKTDQVIEEEDDDEDEENADDKQGAIAGQAHFTRINQADGQKITCQANDLKLIPLMQRLNWINYYSKHPDQFILFWIPIHWSKDADYAQALSLTAFSKPIGKNNFMLTTFYLRQIEIQFGLSSLLDWLKRVSYTTRTELKTKGFSLSQFMNLRFCKPVELKEEQQQDHPKQKQSIKQAYSNELLVSDRSLPLPEVWIDAAKRAKIDQNGMMELFEVFRNTLRSMARAEVLRKELKVKKAEIQKFQEQSAQLGKALQDKEPEIVKDIALFQDTALGRDFLEHLGIKYSESRQRINSNKFEKLKTADKALVLKHVLYNRLGADKMSASGNQPLFELALATEDQEQINSVHVPEIMCKTHVCSADHNRVKKKKAAAEGMDEVLSNDPLKDADRELALVKKRMEELYITSHGSIWDEPVEAEEMAAPPPTGGVD